MTRMAPPSVSIVLPVYNAEPFLAECLDSILPQRGVNFELIIVDDGSNDASGDICEEYGRRDGRIRIARQKNEGPAAARNRGLGMATGQVVGFVDADDYLEPDAFGKLWRERLATGADMVRADVRVVFDAGLPNTCLAGSTTFLPPKKGFAYIEDINGKPLVHFAGWSYAALFDMRIVKREGIEFAGAAGEDIMFCVAFARHIRKYAYLDEVVYNYRRNVRNSVSSTYSSEKSKRLLDSLNSFDALREYLLEREPRHRVEAALGDMYANFFIRYLVVCAADHLMGEGDAYGRFRETFLSPPLRSSLKHYDARSHRGKSKLLPWLVRLRLVRIAFWLCRLKAAWRYVRELSELSEGRR